MRRLSDRRLADSAASVRENLRQAAKQSGMTYETIGLCMGFPKSTARIIVGQILSPSAFRDLRLSTLLAFADAIGRPLKDLL